MEYINVEFADQIWRVEVDSYAWQAECQACEAIATREKLARRSKCVDAEGRVYFTHEHDLIRGLGHGRYEHYHMDTPMPPDASLQYVNYRVMTAVDIANRTGTSVTFLVRTSPDCGFTTTIAAPDDCKYEPAVIANELRTHAEAASSGDTVVCKWFVGGNVCWEYAYGQVEWRDATPQSGYFVCMKPAQLATVLTAMAAAISPLD